MFNFILKTSITHRYIVLSLSLVIVVVGLLSYEHLIIDAVPDITNIQVQINTEAQGYSPSEVEQRITLPIELFLAGVPSLEYTRSLSRYGLSQVTAVFKEGTDIYFARQLIAQRIQESKDKLPSGINPSMSPIASGLGEIFMFTLENQVGTTQPRSLHELRELQDWVVRPQLQTIPGVVEINSIGGASKQIVVTPDLEKLVAFDLSIEELSQAIANNNINVGAGFIENNGEQFLIRVPAQVENFDEINDIAISVHEGTPIYVRDVASVEIGAKLRTGAATKDGKEVVLGTVMMLIGENGRDVSNKVKKRLRCKDLREK